MTDASSILTFVRDNVPDLQSVHSATKLGRGQVNYVWRVSGPVKSVIVKIAPPFVAAHPEVTLDPGRIVFEARMLKGFEKDALLRNLTSLRLRTPGLLAAFPHQFTIVMEDFGQHPELDEWINAAPVDTEIKSCATRIGVFLANLHVSTSGGERYAAAFSNIPIQEARFLNQYSMVGDAVRREGVHQWERVDEQARNLGRRLLQSGTCLTMGDLWPRSILMAPAGVRIIDWEFCHYGHPAQDVAHLSAHLWMQAQCGKTPRIRRRFRQFNAAFVDTYKDVVWNRKGEWLQTKEFEHHHAVHFGCEILARTIGRFVEGYLYDREENRDHRDAAIQIAVESILGQIPFFD